MRFHFTAMLVLAFGQAASSQPVDAGTIDHKVLLGYQGWFSCPGDGGQTNFSHWLRRGPEEPVVDMYPDLTEFDKSDLCAVPGMTIDGKPAYLYSAWNPHVVDAHFRWMKQYGLD